MSGGTRRCSRCRLTKPVARFSADRPELCKTCAAGFDAQPSTSDALVRDGIIRDLIRQAESSQIPDSEGGWDIRYDVADWLRGRLPVQEVTR